MKPNCADDRECALRAPFTFAIQSEDSRTLLTGLRALMGEDPFAAHLFARESLWGAWLPAASLDAAMGMAARVEPIPVETRHWIRVLIEDERAKEIVVDRTFHPGGEVTEPVPAW